MSLELPSDAPRKHRGRNWLSLTLFVAGVGALVTAAVLFFTGAFSGTSYEGPGTAEAFGPDLAYFQAPPTATLEPTLEPQPTPEPNDAPIVGFAIPRFAVNAPVIVLGVDESGQMEAPEDPWDVAWYDFTARPGSGSNAVFAGHVDWTFENGPAGAVFWNLKDLVQGDVVEVKLADDTVYQYRVVSRELVDPDTIDVGEVVGETAKEVVTLITCGGTWDPVARSYKGRIIVRAERVTSHNVV